MMDCELKLRCPNASSGWIDGITMGISYLVGEYVDIHYGTL